jgi:hypothetical protein
MLSTIAAASGWSSTSRSARTSAQWLWTAECQSKQP